MKRTTITIKTTKNGIDCGETTVEPLEAINGWHGVVTIKIKDGLPVDVDAPVQKLRFEKIK